LLLHTSLTNRATALLVLQDGRQRNSYLIQVVFRDFLGTEMKMYCVAIAQVEWCHRKEGKGEDSRERRAWPCWREL